ncbi:hypothetical protein H100_06197 [Trichophyton rubrum MR850]|nr:hypothetical protein H100_06197 [Trichophyton rubrum MR850]
MVRRCLTIAVSMEAGKFTDGIWFINGANEPPTKPQLTAVPRPSPAGKKDAEEKQASKQDARNNLNVTTCTASRMSRAKSKGQQGKATGSFDRLGDSSSRPSIPFLHDRLREGVWTGQSAAPPGTHLTTPNSLRSTG